MNSPPTDTGALQAAIAALEAQRPLLGNAVADAALVPLQHQLALLTLVRADGSAAQQLKQATVMFVDIVGSTALAAHMDAEDISAVIDGALSCFTACVQAQGGRVLQYAGDNLLAAFGADRSREEDPECAVRAGLAILAEGCRLAAEVERRHGQAGFDVRVGLHTGPVLLGGGVDAEGTIRGQTVNIAARLEQAAAPGSMLISLDTHRHVRGLFRVQAQAPLVLKGIDTPMASVRVLGDVPRSARQLRRGLDGAAPALVGRTAEWAALHGAWQAVCSGQGLRWVSVLGEAGLGKSRLATDFAQAALVDVGQVGRVGHVGHAPVLRSRCTAQGLQQPNGVWRDLLFGHLGVQDSDTLAQAQAKLVQGLAPVFGEQAAEKTALLAHLAGMDSSASPHIAGILLDGRQLRARALHAASEFLRHLAAQAPRLLLLDDLHWADEESLAFVEHLASSCSGLPLLLLCTARPALLARRPAWGQAAPAHLRLTLAPLDPGERQGLAQALMSRVQNAPPALLNLLVERADGNPYYMEELAQMLVDSGVIVTGPGAWQVAAERLQDLQVPPTLVALLQTRLDGLKAAERQALQLASVVGPRFWDEALAALDAQAPESLPGLCERDMAEPSPTSAFEGTQEFAFRHHLLHQVTYDSVLKRHKREQHGQAARWLESRSVDRVGENAALIAEHHERAGNIERAAHHWAMAAEEAARRQADSAVLAHVERALALPGEREPRQRFALLRARLGVQSRRSELDAHAATTAELVALAEALDDDVLRLRASQGSTYQHFLAGQYLQIVALCAGLLPTVEAQAPKDAAWSRSLVAVALHRLGRVDEATAEATAALALARQAGDRVTEGAVLNNLGLIAMEAGRFALARQHYGESLCAYRAAGSRHGEAIVGLNLAQVMERCGELAPARAQMQANLQLCRDSGNRSMEALGQANLACLLIELGPPAAALDCAQQALGLALALGELQPLAYSDVALFNAAFELGRFELAQQHGRRAMAYFESTNRWAEALESRAGLAETVLRLEGAQAGRLALEALLAHPHSVGNANGADDTDGAGIADTADNSDAPWLRTVEPPLIAWRMLTELGDPRATAVLAAAHANLMTLAQQFDEPGARATFLQATRARRALLQAWAEVPSAAP